jgi:hypothetical protein
MDLRCNAHGPGELVTGFPVPEFEWRRQVCPKFLGDPNTSMPCSQTPAGLGARPCGSLRGRVTPQPSFGRSALRCCLPPLPLRRLPRSAEFRGSIARPTCSLSTLRHLVSPSGHARLASGGWPALTWQARPAGSQWRFQICSYISSPSSRLLLAQGSFLRPSRSRPTLPNGVQNPASRTLPAKVTVAKIVARLSVRRPHVFSILSDSAGMTARTRWCHPGRRARVVHAPLLPHSIPAPRARRSGKRRRWSSSRTATRKFCAES